MSDALPYLRWAEAMDLVQTGVDPTTKRLLSRVGGALARHHAEQDLVPDAPVDTLFFFRILAEVLADHATIRAIPDGAPADEWFEDDA